MIYYNRRSMPHIELIKGEIKVDTKLLTALIHKQTSKDDDLQIEFLDYIQSLFKGDKTIKFSRDSYGNMYAVKGKPKKGEYYPCVVSHVDTVQDIKDNWETIIGSKFMYGFNNTTGEQCGLGADDRCGNYFAIEMLKRLPVVKAFFSMNEESGCLGSRAADVSFFNNCSMLVQLDRRSYTNDIVENTNGIQVLSEEFKEVITPLMGKYNYQFNTGTSTDIGALKKLQGVICIAMNISNGSLNEHTDQEIISLAGLNNGVNLAYEMILEFGNRKWEHVSKEEVIPIHNYLPQTLPQGLPAKYTDKFQDWDDWSSYNQVPNLYGNKTEKKWHYSDHFNFTPEDEEYVQDCLETGTCPICSSNLMEELLEDEIWCTACNSVYNIPEGKYHVEILEEIEEMLAEQEQIEAEIEMQELEEREKEESVPTTKINPRDCIDWAEC